MSPNSTVTDGSDPFLHPLPASRDVPSPDRQTLFIKKLNLCCHMFDFNDPTKDIKEKEIKRQTLFQLVEYLMFQTEEFTEHELYGIKKMLEVNLFRTLPPPSHNNDVAAENADVEEQEPTREPAWPHLEIVYQFLLRYISSLDTDAEIASKCFDHSFLVRLLDLFDSEDARERAFLMKAVHGLYGKFMVLRPSISKAISHIFYVFVHETEKHNGIAELLELLGSIIDGYSLPLKEEHKVFLRRALIPLHKPRCFSLYSDRLSVCIFQFLQKDCKLADTIIRGLLRYWPVTNSQKEISFLFELEEVLESTMENEFRSCMIPLFRQISRCLKSIQFQVADQTLLLCKNDYIVSLITENRQVVLPLIFGALDSNTGHWNRSVQRRTASVRKLFFKIDKMLFLECQRLVQDDESRVTDLEIKREIAWERLEEAASFRPFITELPS